MVAYIPPGILAAIWIARPGSPAGSVERLAGGEHDPGDPFGAALGEQDLRSAPVVDDQRDLLEPGPLQELADQQRHPVQRQVGVWPHRPAVPAERQCGQYAPVVGAQVGDHLPPHGPVHEQPVQEDHTAPHHRCPGIPRHPRTVRSPAWV